MEYKEPEVFDNFPWWIIIITNIQALLVYIAGAYLVFQISFLFGILYILYLLTLEISVYKEGCVVCYYYGRRCAFNRGRIAKLFFKKDDPKKFCQKKVTLKNLMPQILATLIPVIVGIVLLTRGFSFFILALTAVPLFSWFLGNPLIYGKLACPHCGQGRICCPANDFFGKKNS